MNKIDKYIFLEISKGCLFILFIFLSIAWLLQFTRLVSLANLIQVDIITILYLSIFLIPNLVTVILPIVIMFGLILSFLKSKWVSLLLIIIINIIMIMFDRCRVSPQCWPQPWGQHVGLSPETIMLDSTLRPGIMIIIIILIINQDQHAGLNHDTSMLASTLRPACGSQPWDMLVSTLTPACWSQPCD